MSVHKIFPVEPWKLRGLPINNHPGAFGCCRKHNFHEGIDLYGETGDVVYAIADGVVVYSGKFTGESEGSGWWLPTDAIVVKDKEGYWAYGELTVNNLEVGDKVLAGDGIGSLIPVLPPEKARPDIPGHSVTMLHLERFSLNIHLETQLWSEWRDWDARPEYLVDPTIILEELFRQTANPVQMSKLRFLTY